MRSILTFTPGTISRDVDSRSDRSCFEQQHAGCPGFPGGFHCTGHGKTQKRFPAWCTISSITGIRPDGLHSTTHCTHYTSLWYLSHNSHPSRIYLICANYCPSGLPFPLVFFSRSASATPAISNASTDHILYTSTHPGLVANQLCTLFCHDGARTSAFFSGPPISCQS